MRHTEEENRRFRVVLTVKAVYLDADLEAGGQYIEFKCRIFGGKNGVPTHKLSEFTKFLPNLSHG